MAVIINLDEVRRQTRKVMQEPRRLDWRTPPSLPDNCGAPILPAETNMALLNEAMRQWREKLAREDKTRAQIKWFGRHDKPTDPDAA